MVSKWQKIFKALKITNKISKLSKWQKRRKIIKKEKKNLTQNNKKILIFNLLLQKKRIRKSLQFCYNLLNIVAWDRQRQTMSPTVLTPNLNIWLGDLHYERIILFLIFKSNLCWMVAWKKFWKKCYQMWLFSCSK